MENMQIQNNLINTALQGGIEKFIFLGSSCIYPKMAAQPLKEEYLLLVLGTDNEWYAIAKISQLKPVSNSKAIYYVSLLTNLYGTHDNFDLISSHVLPAMMQFHEAKENNHAPVTLWEAEHHARVSFVDDMAEAVVFALENKTW
jgi:GDP-L-fucose synthase